jgi:hypothetical protein
MDEPQISLKFDGGDADKNSVDMKYYALALQGVEEIVSDGLILLAQQRLPMPRERAPLLVKVREAKAGSHITPTDIGEAFQMLQLGIPIITDIGASFLYEWTKAIIAYFSGKPTDMDSALSKMVEMNRDHLGARDRSDERAHEERMLTLDILREAVMMQGGAAERFAAPVGRSVGTAALITRPGQSVEVDKETAETIREHNKLVWEKIAPLRLRTDGFKFHTSGLSIENPEGAGYLMATVKDPSFAEEENPYTEAAQRRAVISVLARKGRRNGVLARIEVLEFQEEIQ